ncbi:uncharacterized protein LOC129595711 [Paramacrobiotus metropolitanus]|uniref:uncharacterized protein LOC129595711 n=1 Tax=Paramacrobiotus metropolitanus TaxID=2943436 RepID=UPI0024460D23|nr:uncharacterized protein LOC129595711 [Paramacrobiotus metropolitanus]
MASRWISVALCGCLYFVVTAFDLEMDCNSYNTSQPVNVTPLTDAVPFRRDRLRLEECIVYANKGSSICMIVPGIEAWMMIGTDPHENNPTRRNYLAAECRFQKRPVVAETTRTIRLNNPTVAVTLSLTDGTGNNNSLTFDVIDPVRNQTIDLGVESCVTTDVNRRIYDVGVLPNLFVLTVSWCRNLTVMKEDFSRMPRIRMILFTMSTITSLEAGTFMDLPDLHSLILERNLFMMVPEMLTNITNHRQEQKLSSIGDTRDFVRRLHCDCSLGWLRNLQKKKPYLIGNRDEGEVITVGDYKSPEVWKSRDALSVDCSREVDADNIFNGKGFSYNTTCYTLVC